MVGGRKGAVGGGREGKGRAGMLECCQPGRLIRAVCVLLRHFTPNKVFMQAMEELLLSNARGNHLKLSLLWESTEEGASFRSRVSWGQILAISHSHLLANPVEINLPMGQFPASCSMKVIPPLTSETQYIVLPSIKLINHYYNG